MEKIIQLNSIIDHLVSLKNIDGHFDNLGLVSMIKTIFLNEKIVFSSLMLRMYQ